MLWLFRRKPRLPTPPSDDQLALQFDAPPAVRTPPSDAPAASPAPAPGRRVAILRQQPVRWELVRSRRKSIGFQIDARGLRVSAPRWVPLWEVERALQEKADWILRKLAEWQAHEARRQELMPRWDHLAPIRVLGETLTLTLDPAVRGVVRDGQSLRVGLAIESPAALVQEHVQRWLREQAKALFADRIPVYSARLGRAPTRWALSSARTRWGSCGPDGAIRLNWRLIHFPPQVIDYVIAHELAHLVELNHSPRFWSLVGELFPDYERVRSMLRHHYDDTPEG